MAYARRGFFSQKKSPRGKVSKSIDFYYEIAKFGTRRLARFARFGPGNGPSPVARTLPSSRAGGQDDVSSHTNSLKLS